MLEVTSKISNLVRFRDTVLMSAPLPGSRQRATVSRRSSTSIVYVRVLADQTGAL
jgi:hypothetical protein